MLTLKIIRSDNGVYCTVDGVVYAPTSTVDSLVPLDLRLGVIAVLSITESELADWVVV